MTERSAAAAEGARVPREMGYRMPAEWEPHEAVWFSWPHDPESFPDLPAVERAYVETLRVLHAGERIRLLVLDDAARARVQALLRAGGVSLDRVRFYTRAYADVWFRDYGPIYVSAPGRPLAMTHWRFNAWGGKYEALMADTRIPEAILREHPMPCFRPGLVLEGGSIDVDGAGTALTTEQCLLAPTRNPGLGRDGIERALRDYLGAERCVWLGEGIVGDDTDGHVDDIARFVSRGAVVCAVEEDPADENYKPLQDNLRRLRLAKDRAGRALNVVELPMPGPVLTREGRRLPASYANFFIGNRAVAVPVFGHANDARALEVLRRLFPGREVVGVRCEAWVHGLGTIHCSSQQVPAA